MTVKDIWINILISILFLAVALLPTIFTTVLARQYLPFLALAFGASAVAVGIQQSYIAMTSLKSVDKGRIFVWGAASLLGFGTVSVFQALSVMQLFDDSNSVLFVKIQIGLFFVSMALLFNAVAAYLYANDPSIFSARNALGLRGGTYQLAMAVLMYFVVFCVIIYLAMEPSQIVAPISRSFLEMSSFKEYLGSLGVSDYLPITRLSLMLILGAYVAIYVCFLGIFVLFLRLRNKGGELPIGIPFFICTIKIFLLLPILQIVHLVFVHGETDYQQAAKTVVVLATGLVLAVIALDLGSSTNPRHSRMAWAMILTTAGLCAFFVFQSNVIEGFPVTFLGLGFLTLGFASLPAQKIQELASR
jgi:hypothetical protein